MPRGGAGVGALVCVLLATPSAAPALAQAVPTRHLMDRPGAPATHAVAAVSAPAARMAAGARAAAATVEVRRAPTPSARDVAEVLLAPPPAGSAGSDLDLPDFLPWALRRDLHDLHRRVLRARTVLFGEEGIVDVGRVGSSDLGRVRLNLQYDPDPGVRFVLVLR